MKNFLSIMLIAASLVLAGCEESKPEVESGFELLASHGVFHFVYVDRKAINFRKKSQLRRGGKSICAVTNTMDYCEVYMWDDRELVSKDIPVENRKEVAVIYTLKDKKVKLKIIR